jgi:hypothetical protein
VSPRKRTDQRGEKSTALIYRTKTSFVNLTAIATNVSYWNWYGFPGVYTASYMLIEVVGFILVGVAAGLVLRKRDSAV